MFDIRLLDGEHTLWNRDLYAPSKRRKVAAAAYVGYSAKLNAVGLYKVHVNHQGRLVAASCAEVRAFDDSLVRNRTTMVDGGTLSPMWVEWLMGWPVGWTDCDALGMDRFRQWSDSHGTH